MKTKTFPGGVHPPSNKHYTRDKSIVNAELPSKVLIPLSQHIGAPCEPLVEKGDRVLKGQKIGESSKFVSAPVHSSVSGTVTGLEKVSGMGTCIAIENDGKEEEAEPIRPGKSSEEASSEAAKEASATAESDAKEAAQPLGAGKSVEEYSAEEMKEIVKEAGIVGMGGATFPAHVKYSPPEDKKIDLVILNGGECEPYLNTDFRVMLEEADRVVSGLKYIMKILGAPKGIIGVEDNKPEAISALQKASEQVDGVEIMPLEAKYPQGGEKQLIYAMTRREVPSGGLPLDVGIVVNNVCTATAVADAIEKGQPVVDRVLTVTGGGVSEPANMRVRIGTPFSEVIEQCGGYSGEPGKIISGGPMMGTAMFTDQVPVVKGTSGILVLSREEVYHEEEEKMCVRCARCVDTCPMYLEPTNLARYAQLGKWDLADEEHVNDCIECGSCTYVCPSDIKIVQHITLAKQMIKEKQG